MAGPFDTLIDIIRDVWTGYTGTGKLRVDASGSTFTGTVTGDQGAPNTVANAWPVKITDGTDTAQVTAAGALQVDGSGTVQPVSQSTSPWIVKRNNDVVTGSLTTAGQTLVLNTNGIAAVGLGVGGTWIGVIYFEATVDGTNWVPAYFAPVSGGVRENNTEGNDQYLANVAGASQVRFRVGAMDSGTVNITILSNPSLSVVRAVNDTAQDFQATVFQSNAANLKATIIGTGTFAAQVTGTVTANAGTNLNTSALNLETTQTAISAKLPATLGQKTSANSLAVVVASDQSAIPVSGSISFTTPQHVIVDSGTLTAVTSITNAVTVAQATAANLNATVVGTGTFAAQVTGSVTANAGTNLNTSALALETTQAAQTVAQGSTTSGEVGPLIQGAVTTAAPSYTTAKTNPLSLTTAGALRVDGSGVTQPISGAISFSAPQHVVVDSGTLTAVTSITNAVTVSQATAANLNATVVGTGTFAAQVTVAASATNIAKAEDAASADADVGVPAMAIRKATPGNTSGTDGDYEMLQMSAGRLWASATIDAALPTGSNVIGALTANQSVNVAQIAGNTTLTGNGVTGTGSQRVTIASDNSPVSITSSLSGTSVGMTRFRNTALSNTAVAVKSSAGNLYYYHVYNTNSSDCFLQFYNVAQGSVTVGTTTPDLTFVIPGGGGVLDGSFDSSPFSFSTAITIAATTTITGGTAPGTGFLVALGYV